jgi:hypothetical protein
VKHKLWAVATALMVTLAVATPVFASYTGCDPHGTNDLLTYRWAGWSYDAAGGVEGTSITGIRATLRFMHPFVPWYITDEKAALAWVSLTNTDANGVVHWIQTGIKERSAVGGTNGEIYEERGYRRPGGLPVAEGTDILYGWPGDGTTHEMKVDVVHSGSQWNFTIYYDGSAWDWETTAWGVEGFQGQTQGETHSAAIQMYGDTTTHMKFTSMNVRTTGGTWISYDDNNTDSVYTASGTMYGVTKGSSTSMEIWDKRCAS